MMELASTLVRVWLRRLCS